MRCNGYMPLGKSTILIFLLFAGTASSQVLNESSPITSLLAVAQELSMQNQYLPATQFYQNIPNDPSLSKLPGIMPSASGMIGPGQIVEKEGYIVELNQEAMVAYEQGLVRQAIKKKPTNQKTKPSAYELAQIKSKAVSYSRELEQAQLKTEASISKLLKKSVKANPKSKFKASFNGMVLDITAQEAEALSKSGLVRKVYPNKKVKALLRDSVPLTGASALWGLNPQGQSCAGDRSKCLTGKGIKIAVIDTGVDYTHPDLGKCNKAQVISGTCSKVSGWDFANDDNDPMDDRGHGTHVAASAAGKGDINSNGLQDTGEFWGVAPDAHIVAYKVLGSDGIGSRAGVISAIEKATDPNGDGDTSDHVDVISMSLGGPGDPDDPISIAVDNAVESGVVAIIAAGNSGPGGGDSDCRTESSGNAGSICSPGTARKAITIGAGNKNGLIAGFSSRGPVQFGPSSIAKPDLLAPGVNICAAQWKNWLNFLKCFDSAHISISGTSMATPHVAGAVALLKQARPDLSPESIKTILMFGAKDLGYDMYTQGAGLIDLQKAFALSQAAPLPELTVESGSAITSKTGGMFEVEFKAKILNIGLASASNVTYSIYLPNKTVIASGEIGSMLAGEQTNLTVSAPIQELYQYAILEVDPENQIVEYLEKNNKIEILLPFVRFAGWPVEYNSTVSSIQAAKLEGNGNLELLLSGTSNIYPVDSQGSILPGWPKKQPLLSSLLAAKPGSNTLMPDMPIFASKNPSQGSKYLVGIRKKDGSYAPGWPAIYNYPNTLSVADVDYDGENEIIARSLKVINILKYNGTQMPGWPKNISFGTDDYGSPLSYLPPAVAADLDENFYGMEIVYSTSQGTVNAIHLDGTNVPGWPQKISYLMMFGPFRRNITSSAEGHPVAADIDGDGKLEVLVRTGVVVPDEYPYLNFSNYVFAWHHNGTQVKGWPKDLYEDGVFGGSPLSIGDIDSGHPGLEVVEGTGGYGSGKLYVFHHDGTVAPGWPQNISVIKTPALADLDGDGNLEIVAVAANNVYIFNSSGAMLSKFTSKNPLSAPSVVDIDNDGHVEIIASELNRVNIWSSPWPTYDAKPWPFQFRDALLTNTHKQGTIKLLMPPNGFIFAQPEASLRYELSNTGTASFQCLLYLNKTILQSNILQNGIVEYALKLHNGSYSWGVKCANSTRGITINGGARAFEVRSPKSFVATRLQLPANNSTIQSRGIFFSAKAVSSTNSKVACDFYVDGEKRSSSAFEKSGTVFAPSLDIANGQHTWHSVCKNQEGENEESEKRHFIVNAPLSISNNSSMPNPAPATGLKLELNLPANSSSFNNSTIEFSYTLLHSDGMCGIILNGVGEEPEYALANQPVHYPKYLGPGKYFWLANCTNQSGAKGTSEARVIYVSGPPAIAMKSPAQGAFLDYAPRITLSHEIQPNLYLPTRPGLVVCKLYVNGKPVYSNSYSAKTSSALQYGPGLKGGTFTWHVECKSPIGATVKSDSRSFTVKPAYELQPMSPANNSSFEFVPPSSSLELSYVLWQHAQSSGNPPPICKTYVNEQPINTRSVPFDVIQALNLTGHTPGYYSWFVKCTVDNALFASEKRTLIFNLGQDNASDNTTIPLIGEGMPNKFPTQNQLIGLNLSSLQPLDFLYVSAAALLVALALYVIWRYSLQNKKSVLKHKNK